MAKSTKVEDYWRQHNIESLFKELTQILVRRMPSDPAIAIVEHLQKKFPKSFKTLSNTAQLYSVTSPHSDIHNESISDTQIERRLSNQSQVSGIVTIPTVGSAFTDLLKQDTNSTRQAPELDIRNLVFANRLTQQVMKMGKDIRSDNDIIDEEAIKPINTKSSWTNNQTTDSVSNDLQNAQSHEEPSVKQLIKYKQQIRNEHDRRLHREKLAELAKHQREREHFFQSDLSQPIEQLQQQEKLDGDDDKSSHPVPTGTTKNKPSHKPIVQSKEEEDILNDENIFQPRKHRLRGKQRNKLPTSRSNTPYLRSTIKRDDGNLICKVCGNPINGEDNQLIVNSQQVSAPPTARSYQAQPLGQSIETTGGTVDDWFESSEASGSQHLSPWAPDSAILPPTGSSTFRRSLFQPINDRNSETTEHQSPIRPLVQTDETKTKRSITPRVSESGIFARSPETKNRPPSTTRSITSPIAKKHQTSSPTKLIPTSNNQRRMSGWSVRENSPDNSDEN